VTNYDDATRGEFQTEYAKQLVSFEGLKFKGRNGINNVTPTDIDGLVQLDNEKCFIFFELKHSGDVPSGQRNALAKLADAIQANGTDCVVFVAEHNTPYPETITAKDAIVTRIYWRGNWRERSKRNTLHKEISNYIQYINKTREEQTK